MPSKRIARWRQTFKKHAVEAKNYSKNVLEFRKDNWKSTQVIKKDFHSNRFCAVFEA
jgi:hypothetical protein